MQQMRTVRRFGGGLLPAVAAAVAMIACSSGGSGGSGNPIAPGPQPPAENPVPQVALSGETGVDADHPVTLTVQASDEDGIAEIVIAWGDGTSDRLSVGGATSHQADLTHAYGKVGVFRIEATATDTRQATGQAILSVTTHGGSLEIGLEHSAGSARLLTRATVRVVATNYSVRDGEVTAVPDLVPGELEISADAVRTDCAIDGETTRIARIEVGVTARVDFAITCTFVAEERIVYNGLGTFGEDSDISSVRPDGSDRRQLTAEVRDPAFPVWSPDGTKVLAGWNSIVMMNYDGTETVFLGAGRRPVWSPDGRRIAFSHSGDLAIADLEGRRLQNIVFLTKDGPALDDEAPNWSPDGSSIVFHRANVVHLINADGSDLRALVPGGVSSWMPDGSRILFVHPEGQIASIKPDGTDVKILTDQLGGAGYPDPSPSGHRILFHSPRLSAQARIWSMNPDGSDTRVIEGIPVGAEHASWGPP